MRSMSTKSSVKPKSSISSSEGKHFTKLSTNNAKTIPLPTIDVDSDIHIEDQLLTKHKSYWLKRKSLFEQYFISSFKPIQLTNEASVQSLLSKELSSIPLDVPKMAPKKKFKIRKDGENPFEVSNCRSNFMKDDQSWLNQTRSVKKARAA